jgi:hypothetical protein
MPGPRRSLASGTERRENVRPPREIVDRRLSLATASAKVDTYDHEFSGKFLGGNGFAAKMIYDRVPSDVGPLDPGNAVVFSVGPLTDTPVWGTSRGHVAAVSPLTGLFCDSNFGGKFGTVQKRTGMERLSSSTPSFSQTIYANSWESTPLQWA